MKPVIQKDIEYARKIYSPLVGQKMILPEVVLRICDAHEKLLKLLKEKAEK